MASSVDRPGRCEQCGADLQRGQLYCLDCGERSGLRSPQLVALIDRLRERDQLAHASGAEQIASAPAASGPSSPAEFLGARLAALPIPSPRVASVLVLAFVGFGVLLGNVAGSRVDYSLADSAQRHVKLVLPATAADASGAAGSESSASEPPESSAEPTPEASLPATASTSTPAAGAPSTSTSTSGTSGPAASGGEGGSATPQGGSSSKLPAVKHVFVIMLSNQPYAAVFGPASASRYLSQTLEHKGELLVRYYAVAHEQLANGVALISGQGPTPASAANCPTYTDITPATIGASEQVAGEGCVYPKATETLAGQLAAKHLDWRAYVQGMDEAGSSPGACAHPALGAPDPSSGLTPAGGPYGTFRNPFVYFHALTDSPACAADDVGVNALSADLSSPKRTPSFSYIVPDRCHDGNPTPCASGAPAGLTAADGFLEEVVPKILASKAYKESGLLVITVDEAPSSGEFADSSSCCGQPSFPNLPAPAGAIPGLPPNGGGQVGALLLSPFVKSGGTNQEPYNHYSLLRTVEDLFSLKHLGYAGLSKVNPLEPSIFSARP